MAITIFIQNTESHIPINQIYRLTICRGKEAEYMHFVFVGSKSVCYTSFTTSSVSHSEKSRSLLVVSPS